MNQDIYEAKHVTALREIVRQYLDTADANLPENINTGVIAVLLQRIYEELVTMNGHLKGMVKADCPEPKGRGQFGEQSEREG